MADTPDVWAQFPEVKQPTQVDPWEQFPKVEPPAKAGGDFQIEPSRDRADNSQFSPVTPAGFTQSIARGQQYLSNIGKGFVADTIRGIQRGSALRRGESVDPNDETSLRNTSAAVRGEALPDESAIESQTGVPGFVSKVAMATPDFALRSANAAALHIPGAPAGKLVSLARGAPGAAAAFGLSADKESGFDPEQAKIAALFPAAAEGGAEIAGTVGKMLAEKFASMPMVNSALAQKALENIGRAGGMASFLSFIQAPQIAQMDPADQAKAFASNLAEGAAWTLFHLPGMFHPDTPFVAREQLAKNTVANISKMIADSDSKFWYNKVGPRLGPPIPPEGIVQTPPTTGELNATSNVSEQSGLSGQRIGINEVGKTSAESSPRDSLQGPAGQQTQGPAPSQPESVEQPAAQVQPEVPANAQPSEVGDVQGHGPSGDPLVTLPLWTIYASGDDTPVAAVRAKSSQDAINKAWSDGLINTPTAKRTDAFTARVESGWSNALQSTPTSVEGQAVAQPTEAQKESGNYKKAHVDVQGLDVTIENPLGSKRSGVGADGQPWEVTSPAHYGYVKGTKGADGDHVDVYIGPNPESPHVFVVDQKNLETGAFDETKSMVGFNTRQEALDAYRKAFSDGMGNERIGGVTQLSMPAFKMWLEEGNHKLPLAKASESISKPHANDAEFTILDAIKELGGIASPSQEGAARAVKGGEYDGFSEAFGRNHPLVKATGGNTPDQLRDMLATNYGFKLESTSDLYDAVNRAMTIQRKQSAGTPEQAEHIFQEAILSNRGRSATEQKRVRTINASELQVGDKITVRSREFEVEGIDPDTGEISLKDGPKFKVQNVPDNAPLHVEDYKPGQRPGGDHQFSINPNELLSATGSSKPEEHATGALGILKLLERPDLGLTESAVNELKHWVQAMDPNKPLTVVVNHNMGVGVQGGREGTTIWLNPSSDAKAVAHEISHMFYDSLSPEKKAVVDAEWLAERRKASPEGMNGDERIKSEDFYNRLMRGEVDSEDYYLSNPAEYLAKMIGERSAEDRAAEQFTARHDTVATKFWNGVKGTWQAFTDLLKSLMAKAGFSPVQMEQLYREFRRANWQPTDGQDFQAAVHLNKRVTEKEALAKGLGAEQPIGGSTVYKEAVAQTALSNEKTEQFLRDEMTAAQAAGTTIPNNLMSVIMRTLGYTRDLAVFQMGDRSLPVSPRTFDHIYNNEVPKELQKHFAADTTLKLLQQRGSWESALDLAARKQAEIESPGVVKKLEMMGVRHDFAYLMEQMTRSLIDETAKDAGKAVELHGKVATVGGRGEEMLRQMELERRQFAPAIKEAIAQMVKRFAAADPAQLMLRLGDKLQISVADFLANAKSIPKTVLPFMDEATGRIVEPTRVPSQDQTGLYYGARPEDWKLIADKFRELAGDNASNWDDKILKWAADLMAENRGTTRKLMAIAALQQSEPIQSAYSSIAQKMAQGLRDKPEATIKKFLKEVAKASGSAARAMEAFKALNGPLVTLFKNYEAAQIGGRVAAKLLADPELNTFLKNVAKDGGVEIRPDAAMKQPPDKINPNEVIMPDGRKESFTLFGDKDQWDRERMTLAGLAGEFAHAEAKNDIYSPYWARMRQAMDTVLLGHMVTTPTKFIGPVEKPWDMIVHMANSLGTRASATFIKASRAWSRTFEEAMNMFQKRKDGITKAVLDTAKAHGFQDGRSANDAALLWYDQHGRWLADALQNVDTGPRVGDWHPYNGRQVTELDMVAIKSMADAAEHGFRIGQEAAVKGAAGSAQPITFERTEGTGKNPVKAVITSSKQTENTLPRTFSRSGVEAVKVINAKDADFRQNLDTHFNVVLGDIFDRSADRFEGKHPFELTNNRLMKDGSMQKSGLPMTDRNLAWYMGQIQYDYPGVREGRVLPILLERYRKMFDRLGKTFNDVAEPASFVGVEQRNSLTKAREAKLAGDWLYDTGFGDSGSFLNFAMSVPGYHAQRVLEQAKAQVQDLERAQTDLARTITELTNQGMNKRDARQAAVTQQRAKMRLGETYDDWKTVDQHIRMMENFQKDFAQLYGGEGQNSDFTSPMLAQWVSQASRYVMLGGPTLIRNVMTGGYNAAQFFSAVNNARVASYVPALWDMVMTGGKFAGNLLAGHVRAVPGMVKALPTIAWNAMQGKAREGFLKAYEPMFRQIITDTYAKMREHQDLVRAGMAPEYNYEALMNMANLPGTRGEIKDTSKMRDVEFVMNGIMSAGDSVFGILNKIFPVMGDHVINAGIYRMTLREITGWERRALALYNDHLRAGTLDTRFNLKDPNDPKNVLTAREWFGKRLDSPSETALARLRQAFGWTNGAELDKAVVRMFGELKAGNKNARLLTPEEAMNMADVAMQKANKGSPINRPMWMKKKDNIHQLVSQLMGWNVATLRNYADYFSVSARDPNSSKFKAWAGVTAINGIMLAAGAVTTMLTLEAVRAWQRVMAGEVMGNRQPYERKGTQSQAIGFILGATDPLPFIGTVFNAALNDMPTGRSSIDPTLFAFQKGSDLLHYMGGAWKSEDPMYGLARLVKSVVPLSGAIVNRLPGQEGSVEAMNARRLMTRYGPQDLLQTKSGPTTGTATPLTPYGEKMLNAAMRGDDAGFQQLYTEAVSKATEMGMPNPDRAVQQMYSSRNPYTRAFKQKLTPEQRADFLNSLDAGDRQLVQDVEQKFLHGASLLPSFTTPTGLASQPVSPTFERQPPATERGLGAGVSLAGIRPVSEGQPQSPALGGHARTGFRSGLRRGVQAARSAVGRSSSGLASTGMGRMARIGGQRVRAGLSRAFQGRL